MRMDIFYNLRKYESYLTTAHFGNYIRSLTNTQLEELITYGAELGIHYKNNHCPKCILNFVKQLGAKYFEHKEAMEKKPKRGNNKDNGKKEN